MKIIDIALFLNFGLLTLSTPATSAIAAANGDITAKIGGRFPSFCGLIGYVCETQPLTNEATSPYQISTKISNSNAVSSNTFLADEPISLQFSLTDAQTEHFDTLFLVARHDNAYYMRTPSGWIPWDGEINHLQYLKESVASSGIHTIDVLKQETLTAGEYLVYAGYQISGVGPLLYNQTPLAFVVFEKKSSSLHRISNQEVLDKFFDRGSQALTGGFLADTVGFSPSLATASTATPPSTPSSQASVATSQTNLQELGVDESDRIKIKDNTLFTLEKCADQQTLNCLAAYRINAKPAETEKLGQLDFASKNYQNGELYLPPIIDKTAGQQLIYVNNSFNYPVFSFWFSPYYWGDNTTEVKWIDVSKPATMQTKRTITLNTALISSRMVGNVLYLVTRKNPHYDFPLPAKPTALGANVGTSIITQTPDVIKLAEPKPPVPVVIKSAETLLPTIAFDQEAPKPLVNAKECYLPPQSSNKLVDNTVITITAIPVDNPTDFHSVCVVGSIDTFYMSTQAIYLASSRYAYQIFGNNIVYDGKLPEVTTEIHKFGFANAVLSYKGSGSIPGHLGWDADKQPFRLGEYNNILKVATSLGDTWNNSAKTRVTVLQEDPTKQQLQEISFLENLGKPGERLYAARFIQNRGYLVTFKITDPLYVLDFNDSLHPKVLGELNIKGYSDYLHPIGENYLLGIGKDAVADTNSTDDGRGAWYQGVKVSLFDVKDGNTLKEVDNLIIGKRGTESAALYDHHALAWLANGTQATLSLPIELHNNRYPENYSYYTHYDYSQPYSYYDWTHTGLYTFTIDTGLKPGLRLNQRLITDVNSASDYGTYNPGMSTQNDRAVIQGSSVHYIHNNRIVSTEFTP